MFLGNVAKEESGKDMCKSKGNPKWLQKQRKVGHQHDPNVTAWLDPLLYLF